jgi:hypothetical protein
MLAFMGHIGRLKEDASRRKIRRKIDSLTRIQAATTRTLELRSDEFAFVPISHHQPPQLLMMASMRCVAGKRARWVGRFREEGSVVVFLLLALIRARLA